MDLRQLAALAAVADHRSFSAAARALHTVQSNVSTHVAHLERELGATLVDRGSGRLTPEGELVLARARRIQAEIDAVVADVSAAAGEVVGTVRVGVIGTTGRWLLPLLLPAAATALPHVALVIVDATTTSLIPQVVAGTLDFALVNLPLVDPDIESESLFAETAVLVSPGDHPLAAIATVELDDVARHPILLEPPGTAFRDALDADLARAGLALTPLAEIDGMRLLATLAFDGFGPAILPATALPAAASGSWRAVPVRGLTPRAVGLAVPRRGRPSAPAQAVVELLRRVIADEAGNHPGLTPIAT